MNSFDRVYNALKGEAVDRPPVFPQIGDHAGILAGFTYDIMYKDAEAAAQSHLDAQARYGYDVITIQVEPSWPVAEACGSGVTYPPKKAPWITDYLVKSKDEIGKLDDIPDFMATLSTRTLIEGTRLLAGKAEVPVVAFITGPLTMSLQLMPYETFIREMVKDHEFSHRLVQRATAVSRAYARKLKEAGATILMICEHDTQMMSPRHTREYSIEYYPELLQDYDYNMVHMCGAVTPHMERNVDAFKTLDRLNMINIGDTVDLNRMRELFEPEIGVAGNIDHIQLLPLKTPEEVTAACQKAIAAAGGYEARHFMLAPGCEITADTPPENIEAFVKAATMAS
ncbi:MAG: uroporphyrinogen decarboxylase family protein [Gammaproteobacteria bacterium]